MTVSDSVQEEAQAAYAAGEYTKAMNLINSAGGNWPKDFIVQIYSLPPIKRRRKVKVRVSIAKKQFDTLFPKVCRELK